MKKIILLFTIVCLFSLTTSAQVPVREEPRHKKVLENKYIRLLDVWIKPGDTSLFHVHATPSLFLQFTNTLACAQVQGSPWTKNNNIEGNASYRSFINDTLVHRVSNCDTVPFHVTDIEILASYKPAAVLKPLPFTVLFENEKAIAYRLNDSSFNNQLITGRGPIIVELVAGDEVTCYNLKNKNSTKIKTGKFLYLPPSSTFYFSAKENKQANLVLFEIR